MVIVTIVVADLLRKTETNGAGILKGAGRSVRSMTRRPVGHCLPRRYFIPSFIYNRC
jgi:hypothetical protein